MTSSIFITCGLGLIRPHIAVDLISHKFKAHNVDNLSNSDLNQLKGIKTITGNKPQLSFKQVDVCDTSPPLHPLRTKNISAVIHSARYKSVVESLAPPRNYYVNNVRDSISSLSALADFGPKTNVFLSSATVYGHPINSEAAQTAPAPPYGQTKLVVENILNDLAESDSEWRNINLRYFNPAGSQNSRLIGVPLGRQSNNLFG